MYNDVVILPCGLYSFAAAAGVASGRHRGQSNNQRPLAVGRPAAQFPAGDNNNDFGRSRLSTAVVAS